jgi:hypothetical protein
MKRRVSQKPSAREMRRAVAYDRLVAKAWREGQARAAEMYREKSTYHRRRAAAMKERGR